MSNKVTCVFFRSIYAIIKKCTKAVLTQWPPGYCVLCHESTGLQLLCQACRHALPRYPKLCCVRCGNLLPADNSSTDVLQLSAAQSDIVCDSSCGACQTNPPAYVRTRIAWSYQNPLIHLISQMKFQQQWSLAVVLGTLLAQELSSGMPPIERPDAFIPVPLHPKRLQSRGYNQAQLLACALAKAFNRPVWNDLVLRSRETPPQTGLSQAARQQNLKNAFVLQRDFAANKKLCVVDDVRTTGATVQEISRLLKDAGAAQVEVWVLARALY